MCFKIPFLWFVELGLFMYGWIFADPFGYTSFSRFCNVRDMEKSFPPNGMVLFLYSWIFCWPIWLLVILLNFVMGLLQWKRDGELDVEFVNGTGNSWVDFVLKLDSLAGVGKREMLFLDAFLFMFLILFPKERSKRIRSFHKCIFSYGVSCVVCI